MTECWPDEWPLDAIRLIEEGEEKIEILEAINAGLLEALKDLVTDYEEIGGEDFYDDAYKRAKEEIRKAEENSK